VTERFEIWHPILHEPPDTRPLRGTPSFRQRMESGDLRVHLDFYESLNVVDMIARGARVHLTEVGVWVRTDSSELLKAAILGLRVEPVIGHKSCGHYPLWLLECRDFSVPMNHVDDRGCAFSLDRAAEIDLYLPPRQTIAVAVDGAGSTIDAIRENEILLEHYFEFRAYLRGTMEAY